MPDSKYLGSVPLFCVGMNIPTRPFLKNDCSMYVRVRGAWLGSRPTHYESEDCNSERRGAEV